MARQLSARPAPISRSCISPGRLRTRRSTSSLSAPEYRGRVTFHYALEPDARARLPAQAAVDPASRTGISICADRDRSWIWSRRPPRPTWPPDAVHLEYFSADPASLAGSEGQLRRRLARHGGEFEIAEGRTIIEVLAEHGVIVDTSCEQGRVRHVPHRRAGRRARPSRRFPDRTRKSAPTTG